MIQSGKLCTHRNGSPKDCPTEIEPALIKCPACNGAGCDSCGDGNFRLTECAHHAVSPDVFEVLRFARFAENGVLPVAGGSLDQSYMFIEAMTMIQADRSALKAGIK